MTDGKGKPARPGVPVDLEKGLRMVLAPNPSPMTLHGTNTYLLGHGRVAVIDPGPDDPAHLQGILGALRKGDSISHILVTHAHLDHAPLARRLATLTGAPVLAFGDAVAGRSEAMKLLAASEAIGGGEGVDHRFSPDIRLADADRIRGDDWELEAIHTPGHFSSHLAFRWGKVVFSGDHVMGWSSSLVSPPDGDMGAYMRSLDRLDAVRAARLYPGHGATVASPADRIAFLARHRRGREAEILAALARSASDARALARQIYRDTPPHLLAAASRNVFAHLLDLTERELVRPTGPASFTARYSLA